MSTGGNRGGNRGQASGGQSAQPSQAAAQVGAGTGGVVGSQNAVDAGSARDPASDHGPADPGLQGFSSEEVAALPESVRRRLEALEAAEFELAERQRELELREEQMKNDEAARGRALRDEKAAYAGDNGGYKFEVGAVDYKRYPTLSPIVVMACDESEAKRFFCATKEDPRRPGKQVDPVGIDVAVRCVDPRRQADINRAHEIGAIRRKRDAGNPLNEQEETKLSLYERSLPMSFS